MEIFDWLFQFENKDVYEWVTYQPTNYRNWYVQIRSTSHQVVKDCSLAELLSKLRLFYAQKQERT